jgi:hypothetical protein
MKTFPVLPVCVALLLSGTLSGAAEESASPQPWFVRAIVDTEEVVCGDAALSLELRDRSRQVLDGVVIPLEEDWIIDRNWAVARSPGSSYSVNIKVSSCSGLQVGQAELRFEVERGETSRAFYVGVRYRKARPRLTYIETDAYYTGLLNVLDGPDGLVLTNPSPTTLVRCSNQMIDRIDREFLVEGQWSQFNVRKTYSWPDGIDSLHPGGRMTIQEPNVSSISHHPDNRRVRPERKRFVVFGELREEQYRILGRQGDLPFGFPGCNVYYIEMEADERDPTLELWD